MRLEVILEYKRADVVYQGDIYHDNTATLPKVESFRL